MLKGWKTVLFNCLAAILPILEGAGVDLGLSGNALVYYSAAWGALNIVLRALTDSPIFKKQ